MSTDDQRYVAGSNPRGQAILNISIALGVLETVAVALRFLARRRLGARLWTDDWLILVALFTNYGMIIDSAFGIQLAMSLNVMLGLTVDDSDRRR